MAYNVRDFGAVGDGKALDTVALQRAVDAVAEDGGGEVVVPMGVYRSGTVRLTDNLTLTLETGATLLASESIANYPADPAIHTGWLRHYLLEGRGIKNFILRGQGRIDGSGRAFWENVGHSSGIPVGEGRSPIDYEVLKAKPDRPVMLYLFDSQDIAIEGVTIVNAAAFTVWLLGCCRVRIHGMTVRNSRIGPNTDVLDIDSSRQVRVSDCDFEAGDDCIAIKSDAHRLGRLQACEDIVVTNCVLSSVACGIRIGYEGDAPIRDCVFSNLTIRDTRHGINMISITPETDMVKVDRGTPIERIRFSGITMRNVAQAFFIWAGNESPRTDYQGYIRNINFSGIFADGMATGFIGSKDDTAIENIEMSNVALHVRETSDLPPDSDLWQVPCHWGGGFKSGGLRLLRVRQVNMERCRFSVENSAYPALSWRESEGLVIDGEPQASDGEIA